MLGKNRTRSLNNDGKSLVRLFIVFAAAAVFMTFEFAVLTRGKTIQYSLFWNGFYSDHFMDFFNTLRDSHDLTWVYQRNVIYPPLSVLLMYFLAKLVPADIAALRFVDRLEMQDDQASIMLYFIFVAVCALALAVVIDRYMVSRGAGFESIAISFFCVVSFPVVYCIERGNLSLLAGALSAYFVFFRNSESKLARELSYIALAVAAGLKLFPAFFGVLLIYDKKFSAAVRTIIYGLIAVGGAYLLVKVLTPAEGGIGAVYGAQEVIRNSDGSIGSMDDSFGRIVQNLKNWTFKRNFFSYNSVSVMNYIYLFNQLDMVSIQWCDRIALAAFVLTEALAFLAGFFCKKEWQRVFIAVYLMLNIHAISMHYTLVYLIPVLVVFLCETRGKKARKTDIFSLILLCVMIVPLPYIFYMIEDKIDVFFRNHGYEFIFSHSINKTLSGIVFQILAFVVFIDIVVPYIRRINEKKTGAAALSADVPA